MPMRTNVVTNPNFETDASGWNAYSGVTAPTRVTANPYSGSGRLSAVGNSTSTAPRVAYTHTTPALVAGDVWTLSARIRQDGTWPTGAVPYCTVRWQVAPSGESISSAAYATFTPDGTGYMFVSVTSAVPATTNGTAVLSLGFSGLASVLTASGSLGIDEVLFEKSATVGAYFDGSRAPAHWTGTANASASVMPAVDVTLDSTYHRVGVTLGGWATDTPVTIYRVHPDTTEWPVRATVSTSGGQTFVWDYEAPFQQAVTYYAMDTGGKVVSSSVTQNYTDAWLRVPGLPSYDMPVAVVEKPQVTRAQPRNVLRPIGRANPIVLTGQRSAPEFELRVRTYTDAQANALTSALSVGATFLVLVPQTRTAWQYVAVADLIEEPVTAYSRQHPGDEGEWATWRIPCTVVDRPVGGVYGDPTASYSAILSGFSSYAALKTGKATYLDVLKGV